MALLFEGKNWRIEWLHERILSVSVDLKADEKDLYVFFEDWQRLLEEKSPCLHLLDATHIQISRLGMRWELASRMKENQVHIQKSAVFGQNHAQRFMTEVIVKASGRKNVRIFKGQKEAEAWLLESE